MAADISRCLSSSRTWRARRVNDTYVWAEQGRTRARQGRPGQGREGGIEHERTEYVGYIVADGTLGMVE